MRELLVYESTPHNVAILSRLTNLRLRETRSLNQLWRAVHDAPAVIAVEVRRSVFTDTIDVIRRIKRTTRAAVIAMPDFPKGPLDGWIHEAGADLVFRSILDREAARRLMDRGLKSHRDDDRETLAPLLGMERELPWKRHALGGRS